MFAIRTAFLGAVGAVLLASPASAATEEWRGGVYLTAETPACAEDGYQDREYVNVRYRPKGLGDNGPDSRISFFHPLFFATSYRRTGNFTKSYKPVQGGGMSASVWAFENTPRLKLKQSPARLKPSTPSVYITGVIRNYGDYVGCTMSFEGSLTKRP
ncbi:hypothetical protein [Microbaculum marinum]|uniref:Uncharacterized protein n=1 Tax=Microbaculum marinum TaxID=1764581 RepID=A0AAW9S193_9HYPH